MYFSRITFNPWVNQQHLAKILCQDSYREHQSLWKLFDTDPDASRDFLYRQAMDHGRIKYYLLSERIPADTSGIWLIDPPKPYAPKLSHGQSLAFTLRANPVITVTPPIGKKQRHDVVMHEKKRIGYDKLHINERPPLQHLIQTSCLHWLQARAESNGFSIKPEKVTVDAYQQHESLSRQGKKAVRYSTVDFQGFLTVTDIDLFNQALFNGIGKSKAFGCGLLLVRRV